MYKKGSHNCKYKFIGYDKQEIKNNMTIKISLKQNIRTKFKKIKTKP